MTVLLWGMVLALLIPIGVACRPSDVWHRLAAFSSVASKVALIILVVSAVRGDRMVGLAGVIVLSVGNAGLLLLANLLRGTER
jgi:multicomponent Na+:H+ antiporter subunit F